MECILQILVEMKNRLKSKDLSFDREMRRTAVDQSKDSIPEDVSSKRLEHRKRFILGDVLVNNNNNTN